jgi:hypothetical protein
MSGVVLKPEYDAENRRWASSALVAGGYWRITAGAPFTQSEVPVREIADGGS